MSFLSDLCENQKAEDGEFPKVNTMNMIDGLLHRAENLQIVDSNFCIIESRVRQNEQIKSFGTNNVNLEIQGQLCEMYNKQGLLPLKNSLKRLSLPFSQEESALLVIHKASTAPSAFSQKYVSFVTNRVCPVSYIFSEHGCAPPVIHEVCPADSAIIASNCAVDCEALVR